MTTVRSNKRSADTFVISVMLSSQIDLVFCCQYV